MKPEKADKVIEIKKYEQKIFYGLGIVFLAFLTSIGGAFYALRAINQQRQMLGGKIEELTLANQLQSEVQSEFAIMPALVWSGDSRFIKALTLTHEKFLALQTKLKKISENSSSSGEINEITRLEQELFFLAGPGITMRTHGASPIETDAYFNEKAGVTSQQITNRLENLVATKTDQLETAKNSMKRTSQKLILSLVIISSVALFLAFGIGFLMIRVVRAKTILDRQRDLLLSREQMASAARKEMLEMVSHDLKGPLTSIKMAVELLQLIFGKTFSDQKKVADVILVIRNSVKSMTELIGDLLDESKIESGNLSLQCQTYDIGHVIESVVSRMRLIASENSIQIDQSLQPTTQAIYCDRHRIEQALSNLIGNAIKFSHPREKILISTDFESDENICISVTDTGCGIAADQIDHVFDRYWQAHSTAKLGSGIGLAIVKEIASAHGGRVWVESTPGKGSCFYLSLPCIQRNNDKGVASLKSQSTESHFSHESLY